MKAEMRIKTDGKSLFLRPESVERAAKIKNGPKVCARSMGCVALLALLGVSGYFGAQAGAVQTVSSPVIVRREPAAEGVQEIEAIRARHEGDRMEEIALLDSVIDHPQAQQDARNSALEQKLQIVRRMEDETQVNAALAQMGFEGASALCGAQQMTVILNENAEQIDGKTARIVEAVVGITGMQPRDIKIILAKK